MTEAEIDGALEDLPGWRRTGGEIVGTRRTPDFATAFALGTRIALLAERRDHHPRLTIAWGRVTAALTSHDAGAITARDLDMAREISAWTEWKD